MLTTHVTQTLKFMIYFHMIDFIPKFEKLTHKKEYNCVAREVSVLYK